MTRTLYAGRLWFEATETELKDWFGPYGPVETVSIREDPEPNAADEKGLERVGHGRGTIDA
jgi:RNA recognition motif-containing protein